MPEVDSALQGIPAEKKIHAAWKNGRSPTFFLEY
jgi:hypothetical protein